MTQYELLFILPNKFTENELEPITKTVEGLIATNNGTLLKTYNYGKRKLAYPIKHFNHGYYILMHFDAETSNVEELNRALKLDHDVLRHIIVKRNNVDPESIVLKQTAEETEAQQEGKTKEAAPKKEKKEAPVKKEKKAEVAKKETKKATTKATEKKETKKTEKTGDVKVADLDQELNKILEDKDIVI